MLSPGPEATCGDVEGRGRDRSEAGPEAGTEHSQGQAGVLHS